MAEGWLRHLTAGRIAALSAGTDPVDIHPNAVLVMGEEGVDLTGQSSDSVTSYLGEPPDLLIDDRGRLAALRSAKGTLFFSSRNPRGYTVESWLRRAGQFDAGRGDKFNCDRLGCIGERNGVTVSYTRDARALGEDCRKADILLSAVPVRRRCPSAALVVDRFDLWREGGHAIWFTAEGFKVKTVAEMRGPRPWAPARGRARWRKSQ